MVLILSVITKKTCSDLLHICFAFLFFTGTGSHAGSYTCYILANKNTFISKFSGRQEVKKGTKLAFCNDEDKTTFAFDEHESMHDSHLF